MALSEPSWRDIPGPRSRELLQAAARVEPPYAAEPVPVVWDHGEGVWITDVDGHEYLDFTSGVLVANVGHSHPHAVRRVQEQAGRLGNAYAFGTPERIRLSERLVDSLPEGLDKAFLLSTGAEATEAALRMARRHTGKHEVLSFHGAFHGRTYGAASAGGLQATKRGFGPTLPGTLHAPYPYCYRCPFGQTHPDCGMACLDYLDQVVETESTGDLGAVIVEPYQGTAGFIFPPDGWLKALQEWAHARDLLLIVDEVQASFGRTGRMYSIEWEGVEPDILCLGKGLGSILPVSAVVARSDIFDSMGPGELSSTWGGNPLASAASLAVMDVIEEDELVANAEDVGAELKAALERLQERHSCIGDVRGRGLVMGIELVNEDGSTPDPELAARVIQNAAKWGLLLGKLGRYGNVIRIAPPLVITAEQAALGVQMLSQALTAATDGSA